LLKGNEISDPLPLQITRLLSVKEPKT